MAIPDQFQCKHGAFKKEVPCPECGAPIDIVALLGKTPMLTFTVIFFQQGRHHFPKTCKAISPESMLALVIRAVDELEFDRALILDEKCEKILHDYWPGAFVTALQGSLGPRLLSVKDQVASNMVKGLAKQIGTPYGGK